MTQKSLDAKEKAGNRPRSRRKRYLNIIYFLDSHRTRTLKFSIRTSYLTIATLCLMLSWSLIASLLLIREHGLNTELRARSRNLLSVIFNYQTRYDQVYEKAYPNDGSPLMPKAPGIDVAAKVAAALEKQEDEKERKVDLPKQAISVLPAPPNLAAKVAPPSSAQAPAPTPAPAPVAAADKSAPAPKEKVIASAIDRQPPNEPTIAIENFSSAVHNETLTVRFSLRNTNKGNKATGTVTAQARYFETGKDGVWLETKTEAAKDQNDSGDNEDPSSDEHFNIRYYKNKVFHFSNPTKADGLFTAVKITVKDEQGRIKEFSFPLTKEPRGQRTLLEAEESDTAKKTTVQ